MARPWPELKAEWEAQRARFNARPWWYRASVSSYYWSRRNIFTWSEWKYRGRRLLGFFIRGWRGWAPHDTWSFDHYMAGVIAGGLKHLAEHTHGWPGYHPVEVAGSYEEQDKVRPHFETFEEWQAYLRETAAWFESYANDDTLDWSLERYEEFTKRILPKFIAFWGSYWD